MYNGQNMFNLDITQDSLSKYLRDRYANRPLIFEDRPCLLDEFIVELRIRNFIAIGDLHKILERTKNAAERFESENPPSAPSTLDCRVQFSQFYSGIGCSELPVYAYLVSISQTLPSCNSYC